MKKIISFNTSVAEKIESSTPEMTLPPLLSFKEVCDYLGLGHTTVNDLIQKGEIPVRRVAKNRIRVLATDLRKYIDR